MSKETYELNDLSVIEARISQELEDYMQRLGLVLEEDKIQEGTGHLYLECEIAILSLRSLKIARCIELNIIDTVDKELQLLLESVKRIEYQREITAWVILEGYHCIMSVMEKSNKESNLVTIFKGKYDSLKLYKEVRTEDTYFLLSDIADYFWDCDDVLYAVRVLEYMIKISEKGDINFHREIVVVSLSKIIGRCPEKCFDICRREKKFFIGISDEYTADFFSIFGYLLGKVGEMEQSVKFYEECYKIRSRMYGQSSWYTLLARRDWAVAVISNDMQQENEEKCAFLQRFIYNIEEKNYDEIDDDLLGIIEGETIYVVLSYKINHNDFHSFEYLFSVYQRICENYNENSVSPFIKLRISYNIIGCYYLKKGNYIRAELAFKDAVKALFPDGVNEIVTKAQIQCNLLMVHSAENDLEQAMPIILELLNTMNQKDNTLQENEQYRVLTLYNSMVVQSFLELDENQIEDLVLRMEVISKKINDRIFESISSEMLIFFITGIQLLLQNECLTKAQCQKYLEVLKVIEVEKSIKLDHGTTASLLLVLAILGIKTDNITFAEESILRAVQFADSECIPSIIKAIILQVAAEILWMNGQDNSVKNYLERTLLQIDNIFCSYIRYFNNRMLSHIFAPIQHLFECNYAIMREIENNNWNLYERVLKYKAMASLVIKEHNHIINSKKNETNLIGEIEIIQKRLALIEVENTFQSNVDEYEEEKNRLKFLEDEISSRVVHNFFETEISVRRLQERMPDNTAIVEYMFCVDQYRVSVVGGNCESLVFDAFVIAKRNQECTINRRTTRYVIIEEISEFLDIIQQSNRNLSNDELAKKVSLGKKLYNILIVPIEDLISGYKKLFIAPDEYIADLPFGILSDMYSEKLEDKYDIVIMECARDLLYSLYGE